MKKGRMTTQPISSSRDNVQVASGVAGNPLFYESVDVSLAEKREWLWKAISASEENLCADVGT